MLSKFENDLLKSFQKDSTNLEEGGAAAAAAGTINIVRIIFDATDKVVADKLEDSFLQLQFKIDYEFNKNRAIIKFDSVYFSNFLEQVIGDEVNGTIFRKKLLSNLDNLNPQNSNLERTFSRYIWTNWSEKMVSKFLNNNLALDIENKSALLLVDIGLKNIRIKRILKEDNICIFTCLDDDLSSQLKLNKINFMTTSKVNNLLKVVYYPKVLVCKRCLSFGHDSTCQKRVRCISCLGYHHDSKCKNKRGAKCTLCIGAGGGGHSTGFTYCVNLINKISNINKRKMVYPNENE